MKEVANAFAEEEITIPWCNKVEKISINKDKGKQVIHSRKVLAQ